MVRKAIRRALGAALTALLVVVGALAGQSPAFAADPDPGVDRLVALLGGSGGSPNLATWTKGLSTLGSFGKQLPFVAASPGGLAGLDDLVENGVASTLAGATTWADLATSGEAVPLPGGRSGVLDITVDDLGEGKRAHVHLVVTRTATQQALAVSSTSPKVELSSPQGMTATVEATLSLWVVWTGPTTNRVYLASDDAHAPRIDIDVTAQLSASAKAAVGILGVTLSSTDFIVRAHTFARVNDPNNDGILAFETGGTGAAELAAEGSLAGLVTAALDPAGSPSHLGVAGSVQGTLAIAADTSGLTGIGFPTDVASTVEISWPDIATGSPTVTAPDLASLVGKFQNMSLRDLADGLAQVATALTGIQQAKFDPDGAGPLPTTGNLDLPFLRGTVADAVKANQVLVDFLKAHVIQQPDPAQPSPPGFDASTVGNPTFTSLQDLIAKLKAAGIGLDNISWDPTTSKLVFRMQMTKAAPASPAPMDAGSARTSRASATYAADGLALDDGTKPWAPDQWAGMRIVAGTSAGEIATNDDDSLTLSGPWIGGKPTDTTPFVIVGPEAQLGAVTFGDRLTDQPVTDGPRRGILRANAPQTFATVKPSFSADLTLVLDLQDPRTGQACVGFEGNTEPCPFTQTTGTFKTNITSLPLGPDRIMVRTGSPLLTADFPIETKVDLSANAGFFQVRLEGELSVCNSSAAADCSGPVTGNMLTIGLKQAGDAQHDLRLRDLFAQLVTSTPTGPSQAGGLLDVDVNVRAAADMAVSIPEAAGFLPAGTDVGVSATWADLTQLSGALGPQLDLSKLDRIFALDIKPGSQAELFAIVLRTLQTLAAQLAEAQPGGAGGVYSKEIPGIGVSLRDLMRRDASGQGADVNFGDNTLQHVGRVFDPSFVGRSVVVGTQVAVVASASGDTVTLTENWTTKPANDTAYSFRSPLDDAIDAMSAHPPQNMQDLVAFLDRRLGTDALDFRYLDDGGTPSVVLDVDWKRSYTTTAPLRLDIGGDKTIFSAEASGEGSVAVEGGVKVGLVVPLEPGAGPTTATALKVLEDSSIGIAADARFTGSAAGTLGPLSISAGLPGGGAGTQVDLQADLSLDLAKSGATPDTPVTFSDFLSGVAVELNARNTPVDCGESLTVDLMVCGVIPLYATVAGGSPTSLGNVALRLPDSDDPADLITVSGNLPAPDDGMARLELPDLSTAFAKAIADFTQIGPGLDGYLEKIEQAMRIATLDGKLPFVGKDLQQGADSINRLRAEIKAKLGNVPASADEARDYVNDKLKEAIAAAGLQDANLVVNYECKAKLEPTGAPTLVAVPATAGTTKWQYKIVASQGTDDDTVPSAPATVSTAFTDLGGGNSIELTWTASAGATAYKILRSKDDADFGLVATVDGSTLTYTDSDNAAPATYDEKTSKPMLLACPTDNVNGVNITFEVLAGQVDAVQGCVPGSGCLGDGASLPLDIGIPGLAIKAGENDAITYGLGLQLHVKAGINTDDGFVIYTHDNWQGGQAAPEFGLGARFDMPATMKAQLAFLDIDVQKQGTVPLFAGAFFVDLTSTDPTETATSTLTIADISGGDVSSLFGISLSATIKADWLVKASVDSVLPGVQANFLLGWTITDKNIKDVGFPTIAFKEVAIDAGGFLSSLLGPVLKKVKSVTGPLQPVIDTLYAPIPVLSDLSKLAGGGDVSLITLAKTFNTMAGGPKLDFVDKIAALTTLVNNLPDCGGGAGDPTCLIPIGEFTVNGSLALDTDVSPTSSLDPGGASSLISTALPKSEQQVKDLLNAKGGQGKVFGVGTDTTGKANQSGFSFPILDDPASVFSLLMGSDVSLVEFDSGPLTLGFTWRQAFGPVYAPPPVMVTLSGSASVTLRFMAGLDTAGIRYAVEAAQAGAPIDGLKLLDGLYFKTTDKTGTPVPVVRLDGEIAAGAAVTALIITVGIEGGLHLTIGFHWNDPNNDGKFRVSEFLQAAVNNPLCLFTTTGRLSLFLRLYITLGFSPFSVSFSITLADITLLDFTAQPDCEPPPPRLGGTEGDTLVVFAGHFGNDLSRGAPWGNTADTEADVVKVTALRFAQKKGVDEAGTNPDFDGFRVQMLGETRDYLDAGLARVVVDGRGSSTPLIVSFVGDGKKDSSPTSTTTQADLSLFDKDAIVFGTSGKDQIQTGTGNSWVDAGGGADRVVTADLADKVARVAGGPGDDAITTGSGDDFVSGDGALPVSTRAFTATLNPVDVENSKPKITTVGLGDVIDWTKLDVDPTLGDQGSGGVDVISVGLGRNRVNGGPGDDKIGVASDRPGATAGTTIRSEGNVLIGGLGSDAVTGGSGPDTLYASTEGGFGVDQDGTADTLTTPAGKPSIPNIIETGSGNDEVWGSTVEDVVTSHSKSSEHARIIGGAGPDALVGGYGTDAVFGGPGDDYVIAEPSEVGARGLDEAGAPRGPDVVEDVDFGAYRFVRHLPIPSGETSSSKTLVGGKGNDHVLGGDGPATIFGDTLRDAATVGANADETCRAGTPVASDPVPQGTTAATGDGNDLILGGAGVDTVAAGGARDRVLAAGSGDLVCGQEGNDVLLGDDGADGVWGGSGADRGYGGSGADLVFGNGDDDALYGQADADVIEGNNGADWATGGDGDDLVYGGTRASGRTDIDAADAGDVLAGDLGVDRIIGDNGTVDDPLSAGDDPAIPYDLDGLTPDAGRGDLIFGGGDDDTAYGGLGNDRVNGGDDADHLEGNNGSDTVHGDRGEDQVVGGSFQQSAAGVGRPDAGDILHGDAGPDLITGDNAVVTSGVPEADTTPVTRMRGFARTHRVELLDLGTSPVLANSGADQVFGGDDQDVVLGQSGTDRLKGDGGDDYVEGGPDVDWVEGDLGDDDLVGGSSTPSGGSGPTTAGQPDTDDAVFGGPGDDVALGDNGQILRPAAGQAPTSVTLRLGSTSGTAMTPRVLQPWDRMVTAGFLETPTAGRWGFDRISGGDGVDVLTGQDGNDALSGDSGADYLEGNGGSDQLFGDLSLDAVSEHGTTVLALAAAWPGSASPAALLVGTETAPGQDDLIGGTSTPAYRDGPDTIEGNGADDVALGDNGSLLRTLSGAPGAQSERVYADRYADGAVPSDATRSRTHDPALPGPSTRFCTTAQATCEVAGAHGGDTIWGDGGNDGVWGQDGDDAISGGGGDDDLYGELGDDTISGDAGRDAIVGDRGGVVNQFLSAGDSPAEVTTSLNSPPAETYTGFRRGAYDRRVDLLHDVDGDEWIGASTDAPMPHDGFANGGRDRLRGGTDADNIHGGYGDDVANGDSGGDEVYGDDGEDVLWGGRGCDPLLDAATPDCLTGGVFDATARGTGDRFVDHLFGGAGEPVVAKQDIAGSDLLDVRPRGSYTPGSGCTTGAWPVTSGSKKNAVTIDPCLWFELTDTDDADPADNNHHQGTDWIYGGWDRDVMQGDVAANGPNPGDRLIDWVGVYNLYTHCNAAYGGFNDVRQISPQMQTFLQQVAWGTGAGRSASDVTTPGTSAFRELALVYTGDINAHGSGSAYPTTPGHFEEVACQP
ncbi:calcium-binding protein [Humibacillus xanthopallidus]|uniref:calcium-binding protein n=1 Tax=Humibacillus xanthopallidus TaxID=412689 RepID=UPI00384EBA14